MGNSGKEMPKISDEFKPASAPPRPAPSRESRLPPATIQGHQPVTRPAPMAPRTPPQASGGRPVTPVPQGAVGLGDRLRAERLAAERLAEQRVAQARARSAERPAPPPSPPPQSQRPAASEKPKFTFSPEELAKDKRETAQPEREFPSFSGKSSSGATPPPPLTPPRPALGSSAGAQQPQRQQPPTKPPAGTPKPPAGAKPPAGSAKPHAGSPPPPPGPAFQPRYNAPPQPAPPGGNYRSLDPPPGGVAPRPRPYADTAAGFREEPPARRDDPLARRAAGREYDSYRRGPALPPPQQAYGEESEGPSFTDYRRRPPVPARARQPAYDEDVNEVFEDEEPPRPQRRRASAQDYNRAYRDYEDGYDGDAPRRRGPWPWLLAILLGGIILTGGIIYYYLTYYKQAGPVSGNVPVIEAPEQGAKSAPETTGGSMPGTQGSAQPSAGERKQIYDRILGDDEVNSNQVVPTQEQPQVVEPTGDNEGQDAAPVPNPASGTQDNSNEPLPLPLPPPGTSDQQGSLPTNANQQTAALGAVNKSAARQPLPEPASTNTADNGAPVPGQLAKTAEQIASSPPPATEQAVSEPEPPLAEPVKPAKPKLKAEKKAVQKVAAVEEGQEGGVEPLVLVPPAQVPPAQAATNQAQVAEPDAVPQNGETAASEQKSKSFFNFGTSGKRRLTGKAAETAQARGTGTSGNWSNSPDPNKVSADTSSSEPQQQVASLPQPEAQPLPAPEPQQPVQQAKPSGSGFIAQLASFRSEAEALAEYDRLRAKHGNVLNGLTPHIVKANIAGAPRYRLGVGPMATRTAASQVCNSLITAGERDCLVRGN
jgi:hypothetical protein